MTFSSCLADDLTPVVVDTSVLINLHACSYGCQIVDALPNNIYVPAIVADELKHETSTTKAEYKFLRDLVRANKVHLAALRGREFELFANLVSERPTLGDGEAATIAVGVCRRHLPIIDDRRGRLRAEALFDGKSPGWSLDLLCHPQALRVLGIHQAVDALYLALRDGRMRIHEDHCDHVVSLIGVQRALECNSLPRYKVRQSRWRASLNATVAFRSVG